MKKIGISLYFCGLLLFIASFFFNATARQMNSSEGETVKFWNPTFFAHLMLAFEPLDQAIQLLNAYQFPANYGYGERGDGYEVFIKDATYRFFYSIPASFGWFAIVFSILFVRKIWKQTINTNVLRYLVWLGVFFILFAVPFVAVDYYKYATTYIPYIHLGLGAYFIVFAYLTIGVGLLLMLGNKKN